MDAPRRGIPPGWRFQPFALPTLFHDPGKLLEATRDRHGDPFSVWSPGQDLVLTGTPDGAKAVFAADPATFEAYGAKILAPILGRSSVLLLSGERHRAERRLLMPPFHGERMRAYGDLIVEIARRHVRSVPVGGVAATFQLGQDVTLDVIIRAVFGVEQADQVRKVRAAVESKLQATTRWLVFFPFLRQRAFGLGPWDRFDRHDAATRALLHETLRDKRERGLGEDILSLLLAARHEDGSPMPDDDVVDELMTLLFAGHETTAITLAWAMHQIHADPDLLERIRAEIGALPGDAAPDDLARLPWLSAVVDETLRLRPVVPLVARVLAKDFVLRGWELPAGAAVGVSLLLLHHQPDIYPDPFAFRPERFVERTFTPFEYAPFGGGARRCIGAAFAQMEAKLVLATWLREGRFVPVGPAEPRSERRNVTLGPRGGVPMRRTA